MHRDNEKRLDMPNKHFKDFQLHILECRPVVLNLFCVLRHPPCLVKKQFGGTRGLLIFLVYRRHVQKLARHSQSFFMAPRLRTTVVDNRGSSPNNEVNVKLSVHRKRTKIRLARAYNEHSFQEEQSSRDDFWLCNAVV